MISVFEYDELGFYKTSYRVGGVEEIKVVNYLTDNPFVFQKAKVNNLSNPTHWVEGVTQEETNEIKTNSYNEKLQSLVADLRIRAKGLAIGKTGSNAYIIAQIDFYQRKHENATTLNPIPEIDADLAAEGMRDFGITLELFKQLIDYMYTQGKEKENLLMCYIEQGRSAILTLMADNDWPKVDTAFSLAENLKGITTVAEAQLIKNQILAL